MGCLTVGRVIGYFLLNRRNIRWHDPRFDSDREFWFANFSSWRVLLDACIDCSSFHRTIADFRINAFARDGL